MKDILDTTTSALAVLLVGAALAGHEGAPAHAAAPGGKVPAYALAGDFRSAERHVEWRLAAAGDKGKQDAAPASQDKGRSYASSGSTAGDQVEDNLLTTQVKAALLADPEVRDDNIEVESHLGEITLSGSVSNPSQMEAALRVARGVEGVRHVENRLKVGN